MSETRQQAERARQAFYKLSTTSDRTAILHDVAAALQQHAKAIFEANQKDLAEAKGKIPEPLYKRLILNDAKLRDVVDGVKQIANMPDPLGRVLEETELDEGLVLRKVQTPIGVIAAIFESRPDVVPQIAALSIRTGNAVLLKGGREAVQTNAVLGHADGVCHVYIDEFADVDKAARIAVDAKAQYPAVCNAAETLLVHSRFPGRERVLKALADAGVELRDSEYGSEYLDLIMNVRIVGSLDEAIGHIHRYGSRHTDSIVTENHENAQRFLNEVDSAGVFWNASTRFADGFRYGFGAEVGVSTNKTHARGPVGVDGLLIYKYQLIGNGHIVATYTGDNARPFLHRRLGL